jgi:iron complex outermembrane receptor protein
MTCHLLALDIGGLLDAYEQASDHSNKTKDESVGNLTIYTRSDLDRMQAYTLKDVLKGLRLQHYVENRLGQTDVFNADPQIYNSMPMRIFLDNRELLSSLYGSGLVWFGDMELDFIDHVEIYQGLPSLDVSVEPAQVVVRLYSKTAEHDAGGRVKLLGGSYGSNMQNIYYTQELKEWSYFVYAGHYGDKRKRYDYGSNELSRNKEKQRVFGSITTQHHRFEVHFVKQEGDAFLGPAIAGIPKESRGSLNYFDLFWEGRFLDESLVLTTSYSKAKSSLLGDYDQLLSPKAFFNKFYQCNSDESLTLHAQKEFKLQNNTLKFGVQYREKWFESLEVKLNDIVFPYEEDFTNQKVYALYLQDNYAINQNNLLTLSYMYQDYSTSGHEVNEDNTHQIRLGYTYTDDTLISKTFASYQEQMPEPYMMIKSHHGNPDLNVTRVKLLIQEFIFQVKNVKTSIMLSFSRFNDYVVLVGNTNTNAKETKDIFAQSITLSYNFNKNDKLELILDHKTVEIDNGFHRITNSAVLRMLNSTEHFDFFNELIGFDGYPSGNGIDYSAGVRYHLNSDLTLSLKGENLFNSGLSWRYMTQPMPNPESIDLPTIDRKVLVGLEWLF